MLYETEAKQREGEHSRHLLTHQGFFSYFLQQLLDSEFYGVAIVTENPTVLWVNHKAKFEPLLISELVTWFVTMIDQPSPGSKRASSRHIPTTSKTFIESIDSYMCMCKCVWVFTPHSACVEVRGQFSLLPRVSWEPNCVIRFGSKCLNSLTHHVSPIYNVLT